MRIIQVGLGLAGFTYGRRWLKHLLPRLALAAVLALVSIALLNIILIGVFYGIYLALLATGMSIGHALLLVMVLAIAATALCIFLTVHHARRAFSQQPALMATAYRTLGTLLHEMAERHPRVH